MPSQHATDAEIEAMKVTLRVFERDAAEAAKTAQALQRDLHAALQRERALRAQAENLHAMLVDRGALGGKDRTASLPLTAPSETTPVLDLIDAAFKSANYEPLPLSALRNAVVRLFPEYEEGDRLRRLLYVAPKARGYSVSGVGRGARWRKAREEGDVKK